MMKEVFTNTSILKRRFRTSIKKNFMYLIMGRHIDSCQIMHLRVEKGLAKYVTRLILIIRSTSLVSQAVNYPTSLQRNVLTAFTISRRRPTLNISKRT